MKKAADASPNRALKRERELRCWSQLEVADRIGTTAFNVGRWERGITFPSSYFRQQLCKIFEKTPQELGFLPAGESEKTAETRAEVPAPTEPDSQAPTSTETRSEEITSPARSPASPQSGPLIWNVPYRRNPFFTGREEVLQTLARTLNPGGTTATPAVAISGLGGMGKTQTALEYIYRYRTSYQAILWARADTRELLITDFASIAALLDLPEKNAPEQSHAVAAVKRWLNRESGWLLVLDNADDLEMASDFFPENINGHLLFTSRAQTTGHIAIGIPLEKLSLEGSILLVLRRAKLLKDCGPLDKTPAGYWFPAKAIAETMDGLPLALDQAGAYIEETGCGLIGYMERYQKHQMALLRRRGGLRPDHPVPVATTWSLSFEKIEQAYPPAAELLRLCAFFHPDAIPEDLFQEGDFELPPALHLLMTDVLEMDTAIGTLTTFSLLKRDAEKQILSLHHLVQVVLRSQMSEEAQRLWAEQAIQLVNAAFPTVSFTHWPRCQQLLPHALVCAELIESLHITSSGALRLLNKAGSYLRARAHYNEAERLLTQALALGEATLSADDPLLAECLNNLGGLALDQGRYSYSEELFQRALTIYQQVCGPESLPVAQCLSNLAENHRGQARMNLIEAPTLQALSIREKLLGKEHPDVAKSLNDLATFYHGQGQYNLAEPLYRRALKIRQRTLGPEHLDVAESLNNLAYLYDALGKYAQAKPLYQQTLAFCEKNLGRYHIYTAISLNNLAEVYRAQEHYEEAAQLHQQALEVRKQTLGLDHPHTAKSLNFLAEIALAQQQHLQGETLAQQALEIWQKTLGEEHHYIAIGLDTLARLRLAQGQLPSAQTLAERSARIHETVLGTNNPHFAHNLNTLAEISFAQKDFSQCEQQLLQALQIQGQALDGEYLDITRTLNNLVTLYAAQGKTELAAMYASRRDTIQEKSLLSSDSIPSPTDRQNEDPLHVSDISLFISE